MYLFDEYEDISAMITAMKKTIMVVGGAGYIGSFTARVLLAAGYEVVILDNLSTGKRQAIPAAAHFHQGELDDRSLLCGLFSRFGIVAVMHFAAKIRVGESLENPALYYENNLAKVITLLNVMREYGCKHFLLSSTAAVYGEPRYLPVDEAHPTDPINPYGRSKLMLETVLKDYVAAYGMSALVLRYFNAAGAAQDATAGEAQEVKQNLIPILLDNMQKWRSTDVFGGDWNTPDGTPIRDYIHIMDIAEGHRLGLNYILGQPAGIFDLFNLGSGVGASVKEIITALESVSGKTVPYVIAPRRSGDAGHLVASNSKANRVLGWRPRYSDISTIISTAYRWHFNRTY